MTNDTAPKWKCGGIHPHYTLTYAELLVKELWFDPPRNFCTIRVLSIESMRQ